MYACRQTKVTVSVLGMYEYVCVDACLYPDIYVGMHVENMHESVCMHEYMYTCKWNHMM